MKEFIKKHLFFLLPLVIFVEYVLDCFRYLKHSGVVSARKKDALRGRIMANYHKIEKGLIMINFRKGFGEKKIITLVDDCLVFIKNWGLSDIQVRQAISAILEYKELHKQLDYQLSSALIDKLAELAPYEKGIEASQQPQFEGASFFKDSESAFPQFSKSRKSIRNYGEGDVCIESIKEAVSLARTAPSVCNRQAPRVHIVTDRDKIKELLIQQGGTGGFSHVVNRLLIVTADLSGFHGVYERNEAYIDGGLFAMNLLYGLHYKKIAACALNCCFSHKKDRIVRKICNIKPSEVFIMMISCGHPPDNFRSALALRDPDENILTVI